MLTMGEATSAAASGMASGVEEGKELDTLYQSPRRCCSWLQRHVRRDEP